MMTIVDKLPSSHVESVRFKHFFENMNPRFNISCRRTVTRGILELRLRLKKKKKD